MKKLFLLSAFVFLLTACDKKPVEIPAGVISRDSMIVILSDIHIAEAMLQLKNLTRNDSTKEIAFGYYKSVFDKHKITAAEFERSFNFYVQQPEMMSGMYDSIITRLSSRNLDTKVTK